MSKDYYNILGVEKNVPAGELKKAYRKLAHKYHPDKKEGNEDKFKEINEAYYVLGDEKRRSEYDRYGRVFSGTAGGGGAQGFGGFDGFDFGGAGGADGFPDLSDILGDLFGGGRRTGSTHRRRGRDISIDLEISFEESVFGTTRSVVLSRPLACETCKGSGAAKDSKQKTCSACQGAGRVHETRKSFFGTFSTQRVCDKCLGKGKVPEKQCKKCKGVGVIKNSGEVAIKIPAGIRNGEMIKMSGDGEAVSGGVPGDLYVKMYVQTHKVFQREGNNLIMDLEIPLSEALLGTERKVKTLEGEIKVKVPAGISYGEMLRLRNKGVPYQSGSRGDMIIRILVKIPKNLSKKSKQLIEELKKEGI